MIILIHPDYEDEFDLFSTDTVSGQVMKTIKEFNRINPIKYSRLDKLFTGIKSGSNSFDENSIIQIMINETRELKKFPNSVLWEIRIPPTDRKHGVFRGYCKHFKVSTLRKWQEIPCIEESSENDDVLIIFTAEIKIGNKDNNQQLIKNAENRCEEILNAEKNYNKMHRNDKKR